MRIIKMESEITQQLKIYTNNVNGLNSPQKRKSILTQINKGKYDLVALQETHICQEHVAHLKNDKLGKEFFSADSVKKRGVVIYVKENIPAEMKFKDTEGRVIAVEITLNQEKILICNIYAPNGPKTKFVNNLREQISKTDVEHIIILGDFNGVIDQDLDKSKKKNRKTKEKMGQLPKNFLNLKKELDLQDVWRNMNTNKRDFTYYSNRHESWSRIDMIWTSNSLTSKVDKINILLRDKSDHCPLEMIINYKRNHWRWRLDDNLIKSEKAILENKKLTKEFLNNNDKENVTKQTIWDSYKAVMRGYLIQQKARANKARNYKTEQINKQIENKEKIFKQQPKNQKIKKEINDLKKEKHHLDLEKIAKSLKYVKQDNFENANKPGSWLARKIRKKKQQQQITKIKDKDKEYTRDEEIREEFRNYYSQLYKQKDEDLEKITKYLGEQKLDKITETQREHLNKEITEEEIKKAIKNLKPNKAPGPDGFTASFYKVMKDELIPFLKTLMNQVLEKNTIPESWKEGDIITIHKEDTDKSEVKNYRPITLLNLDYKIFTNILANRFKNYLTTWIGPEQKGFLPGRHMKENVRTIVDVIEFYETHHQKELTLLSINAEKAFDNLNWRFIKLLFKEIDIGYQFYNAIDTIYMEQRAKILVNGQYTKEIPINKGTRQGCPLSPLIFIFAIEILIRNIRKDDQLKGTKIANYEFKMRAFANDLICIIENPKHQIQKWLNRIEEYGSVAGFYLNKKKTKIMTKNIPKKRQEEIEKVANIQIIPKLKYLGIWLTAKNAHLLKNNYQMKWNEIKKDLQNWKNLKISILGRISIIKMNVLPKLLYLFQNLPVIRNNKLFMEWQREIKKFIWKGKKARINYTIMTDDKRRGGFGLPNLKLYYESCALAWVKDWATLEKNSILALEGFDLRRGWHSYLWYGKRSVEKNFGNHFIRSSLIKIWEKYKGRIYTKIPLWISPLEANQKKLLGWTKWPKYKEILRKKDGQFQLKQQEEIRQKYNKISWFQYAQLKEQFGKDKKLGFNETENFWDTLMQSNKKEIARIYKKLLEWSTEIEYVKICATKWAKNIGRSIMMSEWEAIWNIKQKYTYASDLQENWLKMFHRWHITPKKIATMYKNTDNKCWKCKKQERSYFHIWWTCSETKSYWKSVHEETQKILQKSFSMKPEFYLLGLTESIMNLNSNEDKIFTYAATAARITFAKYWKQREIPTNQHWLEKLNEIYDMDKLTYLMKINRGNIIKSTNWEKYEEYKEKAKEK
uniref:Reverse transcriptase domain-containing protein n=1 Tax=Anolis carolinensis TaxID=28377 RepID=A0A803TE18_ANOCA